MNSVDLTKSRIYVAGHRGLVGSAIMRRLQADGCTNLITRSHSQLDLTNQQDVAGFFEKEKPEYVFLAAAKVGGIHANDTYGGDFIYQNLMIQTNIMHQSYLHGVKRLLFLGSSCIYPKLCPQPMKEEYLLTGPLEPTNSPYAVAKIAGIEMCHAYNRQYGTLFIPVMPTNLYGNNDNFDLENSHVLPALIRKFHLAKMASEGNIDAIQKDEARFGPIPADIKEASCLTADYKLQTANCKPQVIVWGTGSPKREFLHVDDMADACVYIMNLDNDAFAASLSESKGQTLLYNIGTGRDLTIKELAYLVKDVVGFQGDLVFDTSKPDGTPQKLLEVSRLKRMGWEDKIGLQEGIEKVYLWYLGQV